MSERCSLLRTPLGIVPVEGSTSCGAASFNCGYQRSELAGLRASWTSDLNEHHLFTDVKRAFAFRDLTDRRIPEHAPFFVYALWLIESHSRDT
jgi:hypothetical protein